MDSVYKLYASEIVLITIIYIWRFITTRIAMINAGKVEGIDKLDIADGIAYRTQRLAYFSEWLLQCISIILTTMLALQISDSKFSYVYYVSLALLFFATNGIIYIIVERISNSYMKYTIAKKAKVKQLAQDNIPINDIQLVTQYALIRNSTVVYIVEQTDVLLIQGEANSKLAVINVFNPSKLSIKRYKESNNLEDLEKDYKNVKYTINPPVNPDIAKSPLSEKAHKFGVLDKLLKKHKIMQYLG